MAKVRWHDRNRCWTANLGERDQRGRRKPVYKPFVGLPGTPDGRRQAQRIADQLDDDTDRTVTVCALLVEDLVNMYLVATAKQKSARTDQNHMYSLQRFCDFRPTPDSMPYGLRPVSQLRAIDLQAMLDAWTAAGLSRSHQGNLVSAVRNCWNWAARRIPGRQPEQLIPEPVMTSVPRPYATAKPVKYADRKEIAAFLHFVWRKINRRATTYTKGRCWDCKIEHRPGPCRRGHSAAAYVQRETVLLLRIAIHTGCRPHEVRAFEWSEVDWEQGAVVQFKGKWYRMTGNPRIILLPPVLVRALRRHYERGPRHEQWCFTHLTRGKAFKGKHERIPWSDTKLAEAIRTWREHACDAKVLQHRDGANRMHLYRLRHASVSSALNAGVASPLVAELHGTSEEMVRRVYGHLQLDALKQAAARARARPPKPKVD